MIGWWRRRREQSVCFHHDHRTGTSWIVTLFIIDGRGKAYRCTGCDRMIIR